MKWKLRAILLESVIDMSIEPGNFQTLPVYTALNMYAKMNLFHVLCEFIDIHRKEKNFVNISKHSEAELFRRGR